MASYTANFGYMVSEPLIETVAIITDQNLAVGRRRRSRRQQQQLRRRIQLFDSATEAKKFSNNPNFTNVMQQPRQFNPLPTNLLIISFSMKYSTKFGFDNIETYPEQFQNYINTNLANVTIDMSVRFLPVLEAHPVIMYLPVSTGAPSPNPSSLSPEYWNGRPTPPAVSGIPSVLVSTAAPYPSPIIEEKANFVVGLAVGLVLAAIVVGLFIGYIIVNNRRKERSLQQQQQQGSGDDEEEMRQHPEHELEEGIEVRAEDVLLLPSVVDGGEKEMVVMSSSSDPLVTPNEQQYQYQQYQQHQQHSQPQPPHLQFDEYYVPETPDSSTNDASSTRPNIPLDAIADSIFSNPSMVSGGGSFSSNPDDYYPDRNGGDDEDGGGGNIGNDVRVDTLQDEFDNYKNQDLEYMRSGVEETVYGAESMMSLAMTRALMGEEMDADVHPSWGGETEGGTGGVVDPESIEANGLCETNDWLRKNEHATLDERFVFLYQLLDAPCFPCSSLFNSISSPFPIFRNQFFQELLNRMVITVRRGLLSPANGTLTIHCCAAMLGLQLEKELPNNVLLVHGMRKTNDLALGRLYLMEAFNSFGDIESAAIAPSNRGFGRCNFSVHRTLAIFGLFCDATNDRINGVACGTLGGFAAEHVLHGFNEFCFVHGEDC